LKENKKGKKKYFINFFVFFINKGKEIKEKILLLFGKKKKK
jgi:hypothetical protein